MLLKEYIRKGGFAACVEGYVRFNIILFWDVMLCSLVDKHQRFGEFCCLHLQYRRTYAVEKTLLKSKKNRVE